ncbi:MAG: 4-hydroxy-tetrahydrodipicolinate synthase [Ruminococcaceae bacterium]|nr:4-hydroxy-tetrahydrodipicolinate synthase [Oscillospiraceae bacterium]
MKRPLFTGLCTALVTPFAGDRVNYAMLETLIRRQIDAGVDAIVLAGTTGESPTLTTEEKLEIFRRGVETAAGDCKIIAGTGSNCTANAVSLSRAAQGLGVDGLLVVTPYYNKATQPGLVKHYAAIAESVELPVIAYNVPSRTGVDISVNTCRELARIDNIVGIKEAGGDISKVAKILASCELPVYSGNDDQTVAIMALGGLGVISVASNVIPEEMNALVKAALAGDFPKAAAFQRKLLPLMELLFCQVNPIPVKAAMAMIGFDVGGCRMPLDDLTAQNARRLRECLDCVRNG